MEFSDSDPSKVRRTLDLARSSINRQQPEEALELLRTIRDEIECMGKGPLVAEYRLLLAEAYSAKGNPAAGTFFEETIELIINLENRLPELELRAREHFADYLVRFAASPSAAREHYEAARLIATQQRLPEDNARIQLKLIPIAFGTDRDDSGRENFAIFKRAAKRGHFTSQDQLAAWHQFEGQAQTSLGGLRFARKRGIVSEDYFKHVLESVRDLFA